MNDQDFLIWIHERLEHVYGENDLYGYMHRLRKIIRNTDPCKDSSRTESRNSLHELLKEIGHHSVKE